MIRMPGMPSSGLAERFPCDASGVSVEKIIANISVTAPVMAALVSKGLKIRLSDLYFAAKVMEQEAVGVLHYLFQHILECATSPLSFTDHLHLALRLEKEVFVAVMLSGVRLPINVCVTAETISLFFESITKLNPAMVQTLSRYSPLWLRIKMLLSAFSCQKPEIVPFIFEIVPCSSHNFTYVTRPLTTMDKIFDVSKVLKYCTTIIGPRVMAVKMAAFSQSMTPLLKCMFINHMLKAKNVDIKHIQSGPGGSSPLHCATERALKSGESACDQTNLTVNCVSSDQILNNWFLFLQVMFLC